MALLKNPLFTSLHVQYFLYIEGNGVCVVLMQKWPSKEWIKKKLYTSHKCKYNTIHIFIYIKLSTLKARHCSKYVFVCAFQFKTRLQFVVRKFIDLYANNWLSALVRRKSICQYWIYIDRYLQRYKWANQWTAYGGALHLLWSIYIYGVCVCLCWLHR